MLVREPEIHRDAAHEGRRISACEQLAAQEARYGGQIETGEARTQLEIKQRGFVFELFSEQQVA